MRFNPISTTAAPDPAPKKKKRKTETQPVPKSKADLLLEQIEKVPDSTFVFMSGGYGTPKKIREKFTQFCRENPDFFNWRDAWKEYELRRKETNTIPVQFTPDPAPVICPIIPAADQWRRRWHLRNQ